MFDPFVTLYHVCTDIQSSFNLPVSLVEVDFVERALRIYVEHRVRNLKAWERLLVAVLGCSDVVVVLVVRLVRNGFY